MRKLLGLVSIVVLPAVAVAFGCGAGSKRDEGPGALTNDAGGLNVDADPFGEIGGNETGAFQELQLTPSNAIVFIDTAKEPPTPAKQSYTARLYLPDGTTKDVTEMDLSIDSALGSFTGNEFTSVTKLPGTALGVTATVTGKAQTKTGTANLTIAALRTSGDKRDFFFLEPYKGAPSPSRDVLAFGTNIKQVDVVFSTDTTGSMSGALENLKANLSTTIFPGLKKSIPSVGIGVVDFKDHGDTWVVKVLQTVTPDITKAQSAAGLLSASGGGDEPEADICAMMHIVTGKACGSTSDHTPAPGTFGGAEFRPGALPVVVNITDAHWHDPSGPYALEKDLMPAFKANNVRFVGVTEQQFGFYPDLEDLPNYLSDYTNTNVPPSAFGAGCAAGQCCTGEAGAPRPVGGSKKQCRLNFLIKGGVGLGDSVVKAIGALSVGSVFDVTAVPSNDPMNADGVDATKFMKALRAMDEGDAKGGCPPAAAKDTDGDGIKDTFTAVPVGTPVCFEIIPVQNNTVPPKANAQFFNAFIDVLGMPGSVKLDRRTVLFLVPPTDPAAR